MIYDDDPISTHTPHLGTPPVPVSGAPLSFIPPGVGHNVPRTMHKWSFLQFAAAQTKLGTKVNLALFVDELAEQPTLVAVPVDPAIEGALSKTIGLDRP